MSMFTVWWHTMLSGVLIVWPIILLAIAFCYIATKIRDAVPTATSWVGFWLSLIAMLAVLISAMCVAWVQVLVRDCGYLEQHLPVAEEELNDECT